MEQSRNTGAEHAADNSGTRKPKGPLDWDARDLKANTWIRGGTGEYENRFFE